MFINDGSICYTAFNYADLNIDLKNEIAVMRIIIKSMEIEVKCQKPQ